jgi:hypothetical protein
MGAGGSCRIPIFDPIKSDDAQPQFKESSGETKLAASLYPTKIFGYARRCASRRVEMTVQTQGKVRRRVGYDDRRHDSRSIDDAAQASQVQPVIGRKANHYAEGSLGRTLLHGE